MLDNEWQWALQLKQALRESGGFTGLKLSDMEIAQHALASNGNVAEAMVRIEALQQFREEHGIPGRVWDSLSFIKMPSPRLVIQSDLDSVMNWSVNYPTRFRLPFPTNLSELHEFLQDDASDSSEEESDDDIGPPPLVDRSQFQRFGDSDSDSDSDSSDDSDGPRPPVRVRVNRPTAFHRDGASTTFFPTNVEALHEFRLLFVTRMNLSINKQGVAAECGAHLDNSRLVNDSRPLLEYDSRPLLGRQMHTPDWRDLRSNPQQAPTSWSPRDEQEDQEDGDEEDLNDLPDLVEGPDDEDDSNPQEGTAMLDPVMEEVD